MLNQSRYRLLDEVTKDNSDLQHVADMVLDPQTDVEIQLSDFLGQATIRAGKKMVHNQTNKKTPQVFTRGYIRFLICNQFLLNTGASNIFLGLLTAISKSMDNRTSETHPYLLYINRLVRNTFQRIAIKVLRNYHYLSIYI